jgi:hypothetical protein
MHINNIILKKMSEKVDKKTIILIILLSIVNVVYPVDAAVTGNVSTTETQ